MFRTDEVTLARLGSVLMDEIGVALDEFSVDDLHLLADCCRDQFVDLMPGTRIKPDRVIAYQLGPVFLLDDEGAVRKNVKGEPMLDERFVTVKCLLEGGVTIESVAVPARMGNEMFNNLTGRQVNQQQRAELKLYRPLEERLIEVGRAYVEMVRHKLQGVQEGKTAELDWQTGLRRMCEKLDACFLLHERAEKAQTSEVPS